MKPKAEFNKGLSLSAIKEAKIPYESLNNDLHWKFGSVNFFPTTLKWRDENTEEKGEGVFTLIEYLRNKNPLIMATQGKEIKILTVDQMFNIAVHSKEKSLIGICRTLHKEIYG